MGEWWDIAASTLVRESVPRNIRRDVSTRDVLSVSSASPDSVAQLHIHLLGRFAVQVGGRMIQPAEWYLRKPLA